MLSAAASMNARRGSNRPARRRQRDRTGRTATAAGPTPAGYCFVCHGERVHGTARAIAATKARTFGAPEIRQHQANLAPAGKRSIKGAPESVLPLAPSATAAYLGSATSSLVVVPPSSPSPQARPLHTLAAPHPAWSSFLPYGTG